MVRLGHRAVPEAPVQDLAGLRQVEAVREAVAQAAVPGDDRARVLLDVDHFPCGGFYAGQCAFGAAAAGDQHRQARRHRLDDRDTEGLPPGGVDEQVVLAHEPRGLVGGDRAEERHRVLDAQFGGPLLEPPGEHARPGHRQRQSRVVGEALGERLQQPADALALDQRADVQPAPQLGDGTLARLPERDRVGDHLDLVGERRERLGEGVPQHVGDHEETGTALQDPLVHLPGVGLLQDLVQEGRVLGDEHPRVRAGVLQRRPAAAQPHVGVDDGRRDRLAAQRLAQPPGVLHGEFGEGVVRHRRHRDAHQPGARDVGRGVQRDRQEAAMRLARRLDLLRGPPHQPRLGVVDGDVAAARGRRLDHRPDEGPGPLLHRVRIPGRDDGHARADFPVRRHVSPARR